MISWKKYFYAFIITMVVFVTAIFISSYLNDKKISEIKMSEDKISTDILSTETQFALLGEYSCKELENSDLSSELDALGDKLNYSEKNFSSGEELDNLKKYYTLLEIKDYLLVKKLGDKCDTRPITILYFYTNNDCSDCTKEGYVLTYLRQKYPTLRVYSFDYDLNLSALKTFIKILAITDELPAVVVDGKLYSGFKNVEDMEALLPDIFKKNATSTDSVSMDK